MSRCTRMHLLHAFSASVMKSLLFFSVRIWAPPNIPRSPLAWTELNSIYNDVLKPSLTSGKCKNVFWSAPLQLISKHFCYAIYRPPRILKPLRLYASLTLNWCLRRCIVIPRLTSDSWEWSRLNRTGNNSNLWIHDRKKNCGRLFFRSCFILFYYFFCANNHLNNVTAVEEGDPFLCHGLWQISSTKRGLILISLAATLPNEKVLRLKRAKI